MLLWIFQGFIFQLNNFVFQLIDHESSEYYLKDIYYYYVNSNIISNILYYSHLSYFSESNLNLLRHRIFSNLLQNTKQPDQLVFQLQQRKQR